MYDYIFNLCIVLNRLLFYMTINYSDTYIWTHLFDHLYDTLVYIPRSGGLKVGSNVWLGYFKINNLAIWSYFLFSSNKLWFPEKILFKISPVKLRGKCARMCFAVNCRNVEIQLYVERTNRCQLHYISLTEASYCKV